MLYSVVSQESPRPSPACHSSWAPPERSVTLRENPTSENQEPLLCFNGILVGECVIYDHISTDTIRLIHVDSYTVRLIHIDPSQLHMVQL